MADKILSIFIDESGDFGPYDAAAPYYVVAMILHNQDVSITENISIMLVWLGLVNSLICILKPLL